MLKRARAITTLTSRGQTVIPAELRRQLGLREGSRLAWIAGVESIVVMPLPDDPVEALRGKYRGEGLSRKLLAARRRERSREAG